MTTIAQIMTRSVATVQRDETLQAAAQRMRDMDVGSLPVLDGQAIVGMVCSPVIIDPMAARRNFERATATPMRTVWPTASSDRDDFVVFAQS